MNVPIIDVAGMNRVLHAEIVDAVAEIISGGQFILGPVVEEFEKAVASRIGVRHAIGMNSGTDAIWLCLIALGIGPGDEVITTPNTFISTVAAIRHTGAAARLVDVDDDENIDPDAFSRAINDRTAAVIAVHLRGRPARMAEINRIASERGVMVLEDASQAFGAMLDGVAVGNLSCAGCFSLHPQKILGACGDAGVVTTSDDALAAKLRLMRNHGLMNRDEVALWGFNSRLDPIQAAILRLKLDHVETVIARQRQVADAYSQGLAGLPLAVPVERPDEFCVYYHYSIMADRRDRLLDALQAARIDARVHYGIPINRQIVGTDCLQGPGGLVKADRQAARQLSLPIFATISDAQVESVIAAVRAFYEAGETE
jgi:dTDP-4-amino-4,6-dideoxygalactose transaminase